MKKITVDVECFSQFLLFKILECSETVKQMTRIHTLILFSLLLFVVNGKSFTLIPSVEPILSPPKHHQQKTSQASLPNGCQPSEEMPRKSSEDTGGGYMPEMGERKKKKRLFGLFSRRKDGQFKVVSDSYQSTLLRISS